ncbi:ribonuclease inhibitor [Tachyglossus aculeatus]|uniref:ribonuclease inhibitor n=1 Tax=Tachyglossus aculeatus TaxID=9261 RepID=UPI0018F45617|nr:ribonuclease inhibitor [Tachyglossus aculeatus]
MNVDLQCEQLSDARWAELLPSLRQASVVRLDDCSLSAAKCEALGAALLGNAALTELTLRNNELGDAGVRHVLRALQGPHCGLRKLSLQNCCFTEAACAELPAVLRSPALSDLQLSDNPLGDAGLDLLCQGLLDPKCGLRTLQLEYCELSPASCESLAAVLRTGPALEELTVSNNELGEDGVRALCRGLLDPRCNLHTLKLEGCGVTGACCRELSGVVQHKESLRDLCLGENKLGDAGAAQLCQAVLSPSCQLRALWLWECDLSAESCGPLSQVLKAKETLRELCLVGNELGDAGLELLCQGLLDPNCKLESLWVRTCGLTGGCCGPLVSMLSKNKRLRELQLSGNPLEDTGAQQLCQALLLPDCPIQTLLLGNCELSDACCATLASVLLVNRSLKELDLSNNIMGDPGIKELVASLKQPDCRLQQIVLYDIYWTDEVEDELKALKESKPALRIVS